MTQPPVVSRGQVTTGWVVTDGFVFCVCGRQLQGNFVCAREVLVLY